MMTTNCPPNTIDSNVTGLAIAEEVCPGQLPNMDDDGYDPLWIEQEPNTYPDTFGSTIKTIARTPIKRNRQRSKGTPVDLDASAGWNTDLTQNNLTVLKQGFFFADLHEQPTSSPINDHLGASSLDSGDTFTFDGANLPFIRAGSLVAIRGSQLNDRLFSVASASATAVVVNEAVTTETFDGSAVLAVVGKVFGAGALAITMAGNIPSLHLAAAPVAATAALTFTDHATAADTVTIGGLVYTFVAGAPANPYEVTLGADATASATNLKNTINGLSTLTPANPYVTASNAAGVLTATAKIKGATENVIVTTEASAEASWNHATLTGGTGVSFLSLNAQVGQWGFLGADGAGNHFANNQGYFRVGSVSDQDIVMDQTTWTAIAEAAGGLTVGVFLGDFLKNENDPDLIVTHSFQLQRTLGKDAVGTQSQYLVGAGCDQLTLNIPTSDKLTVDMSFIGETAEYRTGTEGLKNGNLLPAPGEDAINSTHDVVATAMYVIDTADSSPNPLFAYITEGKIAIKNNMSANKAVGVFGSIGFTVGIFEVSGTATAYFQDVDANKAIIDSADVGMYLICAKHNAGQVFDMGLVTLGGGGIKIEANKPITLALTTDAGEDKNGATLTHTIFNYLPLLAIPE